MPPIRRLLVANRGEIASRIIKTARAMGITTVAVFSDPDEDAPFVSLADQAVHLPGRAPSDTYLNIGRILAAAESSRADAVHPGYGFLSENAAFARACATAGLIFVGPPAEAIEAMGSKPAAKTLMAEAGVPVLPGVTVDQSLDLAAAAEGIGWPVLVKAAYGGGGRGMRVARSMPELDEAVASATREAAAAFGDGTVFLERFVESPRHIEVQIFADSRGQVIQLFERECSIQRRYQKIIEESPSPALNDAERDQLGAAAVTAAKALGYVGAGTVEFVVAPDGDFFFLEVNTRLQVEHPVTEAVTGLDLVRLQITVAEGERLPVEAIEAVARGHAIEARLYAEDVGNGFLPASGTIRRLFVPPGPGVRVDAGYADGSVVSTFYDAMLAKVIAWAPGRSEAAALLAATLAGARIHGVTTNRDLLVGILRNPEFLAGITDTGFLERNDPVALSASTSAPPAEVRTWHAMAAALTGQADRRARRRVQTTIAPGWRNVATSPQRVAFDDGDQRVEVAYQTRQGGVSVSVDQQAVEGIELHRVTAEALEATIGGVRRRLEVQRIGATSYVDSDLGSSVLVEVERFPLPQSAAAVGSLLAPMPGSVVRLEAVAGADVRAGDTLVVLEAMKMEHSIRAPYDGTVGQVGVVVGQQVDTGTVLVVVEAAGP
ncbi:MAG TPA: biotin carboxylase N-terminal domain-containing protein [Acidimicrobiales bacterium]